MKAILIEVSGPQGSGKTSVINHIKLTLDNLHFPFSSLFSYIVLSDTPSLEKIAVARAVADIVIVERQDI